MERNKQNGGERANDFLLEKRLRAESPELHRRVADCVTVLKQALKSYAARFPFFTDHSVLHSMDVLEFCNRILGDQAEKLSPRECYVLIMSCYLHDIGMGISEKDYLSFRDQLGWSGWLAEHPEKDEAWFVRDYHHELSGLMIRKYAAVFEIPDEDLVFAIVQVSRGHRKTDLFDAAAYPDLQAPDGVIRTAFLAAVLRLADDIDMGVERNPELLFDPSGLTAQRDIDIFGIHESIRTVEVRDDRIILHVAPKEPRLIPQIEDTTEKIRQTLEYCRAAAAARSDLRIRQEEVMLEIMNTEG